MNPLPVLSRVDAVDNFSSLPGIDRDRIAGKTIPNQIVPEDDLKKY